jgi:hypothetical protein
MSSLAVGQSTGKYTYQFLSLPQSARITGLGGTLIAVKDDDVNLVIANPSLLNEKHDQSIAINHNFHFAGVSNGHVAYAKTLPKWGVNMHIGMTYISYGDFKLADEYDNVLGSFKASEKAIALGLSKQLNERISVGANLKGVFANYESYASNGLAADLGVSYQNIGSNFLFAMVIKNLGSELAGFRPEKLGAPLDIQIGFSKKLKYLPFRFSITAHQLQQWNIRYDDPNVEVETDLFGVPKEQSALSKEIDNLFRHLAFSGEFLLGKKENFRLRFGYNHLRKRELSLSNFRSLGGFSLGFGIKVSMFRLDYGVGYHHVAGAANHLSISTNINNFKKSQL